MSHYDVFLARENVWSERKRFEFCGPQDRSMSDEAMSPVSQEIEEPLSNSILLNSDSSCSLLKLSQNSTATEENSSVESMEFQDERCSASDTEADSAITLVKCLNSESPSSSFVSRRNDNSAIIRLNNELLKAKRSNWEVVDALGKAYQDIKNLRLREQRLNAILSSCTSKHSGTNGFNESLSLPDGKIIELQLALRREEAVKTREDLRVMIEERDRLKEKLDRSENDRRLVMLTSDHRERELELSQNHINDLAANIKEKDAKILSVQEKLFSLEEQIKAKDEEIEKIRDEKHSLREAVIRSEREIETLTEKLQNLLLYKEENTKHLKKNAGHTLTIETFDSNEKDVNPNGLQPSEEESRLEKELRYLQSRHNQDLKVIHELSSKLKEWESIVKSMNDYVQDSNQQQLEARKEIADYVQMLERQLHKVKRDRTVSINEPDRNSDPCSSQGVQTYDRENTDSRDGFQVSSQLAEQYQSESVSFEHYLKSSTSDFDEDGGLLELSDNDPFEGTEGQHDLNLSSCFQSFTGHLVQPENLRMAKITTIEGFVNPHAPRETNLGDSRVPKRPPRKTSSGKRRKLPEAARRMSIESTDSAVTPSDETLSITSLESQVSRDKAELRRGSRGASNRRLPSVPSGEEITLATADTVREEPARELPSVTSLYKAKGPNVLNNQRQDSGLGESLKNSPVPPEKSHKFSFTNLRRKFSKEKTGSGSHVDVESLRHAKKGLFQRKLSLMRRRRRKNSVGTASSASDSFRTVTPLNSDTEDTGGLINESFDGGRCPSSMKTSTPRYKGDESSQLRRIRDRRRRACLLLIFQHLNPIELCGLARVCHEWREMSKHPVLWKHVTLENVPLNNMGKSYLAVAHVFDTSVNFKDFSSLGRSQEKDYHFRIIEGLKKIKASPEKKQTANTENMSCYLERGMEFLLKAAGSNMVSLHIQDCGVFITDRCLALAGCHCKELQEIVYISDSFPACPEALWAMWPCRQLVTLRVPPMFPCDHSGRFNDKSLETISNCWPNLRHLSVGGPSVTSAGLIQIAKGCLRLQELELDRTIMITEEIAHAMCLCGLRGLETISFTFTPVSPGAIKELLGACPRLERIEVHIGISDYFRNVEDDVSKRKYKRIVKKLTALKGENPELARVLWIKGDYG